MARQGHAPEEPASAAAQASNKMLDKPLDGGQLQAPSSLHEPASCGVAPASDAPVEPAHFTQLFRFADREDMMLMLLGTIGAVGNGLTMPIFTIIFGDTMNSFGTNLNNPSALQEAVNDNVLKLVWIGIGAFVGSYLQMACWTATASRQVNRIRHRYLDSVLRQDVAYFDTQVTSGLLLHGLTEDCIKIQQGLGEKLGMTIYAVSCFVGGMIVAFVRGWAMTLVMLAASPVLIAAGFLASRYLHKSTAVAEKAYADANTIAQQALSNVRTVYSFNAEERTVNAYSGCLEQPLEVGIRQGFVGGLTLGLTNGTLFCMYALALWYGSTRVVDGAYTGGQVLNVLTAVVIGAVTLGTAAPNLQHFLEAKVAGGRIFSLMSRPPAIDLDAPGETSEAGKVQGHLEFKDVAFAYPARPDMLVFSCFNLEVPAGKSVALVGESGSGKSTVIGLIERFYDPLRGQVLLDGVNIRQLQLRFLRSQLSLVSQEPTLFATTISANILYAKPGATMEEVIQAAKAANAHQFISNLPKGYDTHVGEKGIQMSGGQKQRIAIARAILKDPKILLLDEATSALDAASERVVQEALDRLMVGRTTVVVAHRLSTIKHADVIAVVKKGEVVEQGTHESLMAENGVYAGLVALQQAEGLEAEPEDEQAAAMTGAQQASIAQSSLRSLPSTLAKDGCKDGALELEEEESPGSQGAGSTFKRLLCCRRKPKPKSKADMEEQQEDAPKPVPIGRVAALNKPELPAAASGLLGSGVLGLQMPAFAIAFSSFINLFFNNDLGELQSEARKWALVFVGIGVLVLVFSVVQSYSFNYMGQKLARRVRVLMMAALLRQEVGWFDQEKNSSGALTSRLASDSVAVKGQFGDTMGMLTQNVVTLIASMVVAFTASWRMTLVMLAVVPVLAVAAFLQFKFVVSASSKEDVAFAEANQTASEAFSGIRTVAAFSMQQQMAELYGEKLARPVEEARGRAHSSGLGFGFGQFVIFMVYALAFWFGGVEIKNNTSSFKDILLAALAIALSAVGIAQAQMYFPDVAKGKSATQRVFAIIDREPAIDASSPGGERPLECKGAVELQGITFCYPARPEVMVLRKFSLSVPAGSTAALVGESGSGKSTVIGLIERFYDPLKGQVLLDGIDIKNINLHWLRSHVALVSQEPVLFTASVLDNIRYGRPEATLEQVMAAARAANAHTFIEALSDGYNTRLGEQGIQLSGGQKQRVAIARAVVKDPRVLLLDEATSALDAESEHAVQEALDRLMQGRTTVVVAHRLSTVRNANCISVMYRGRIIEQGTHEELMALGARGTYARLVRNQLSAGAQ